MQLKIYSEFRPRKKFCEIYVTRKYIIIYGNYAGSILRTIFKLRAIKIMLIISLHRNSYKLSAEYFRNVLQTEISCNVNKSKSYNNVTTISRTLLRNYIAITNLEATYSKNNNRGKYYGEISYKTYCNHAKTFQQHCVYTYFLLDPCSKWP